MDPSHNYYFAMAGNGPITNRGCQAIVLGTRRILQERFGPCRFLLASFAKDPRENLPQDVEPMELSFARPRWSSAWWSYQIRKRFRIRDHRTEILKMIRPRLVGCDALFSIGGDGYSIDYGYEIVERLMHVNDCAQARGIPIIIWGASIGPFDTDKSFETRIARHLAQIELIVAREPLTYEYLRSLGLEKNVLLAPDPAFAVEPLCPNLPRNIRERIERKYIGLNISPILAKYVTQGDLPRWMAHAAQLVSALLRVFDDDVVLVPHVTSPTGDRRMDDEMFLNAIYHEMPPPLREKVVVLPGDLSCRELKWLISRAEVFVGARTHSTIAALSTGTPCISIAYSTKAWGINKYMFGNSKWVLPAKGITPGSLTDRVERIRLNKASVCDQLRRNSDSMHKAAFAAAEHVSKLISTQVYS
jgi:polysaccharide pyruvyl transferase WcaK-like protein